MVPVKTLGIGDAQLAAVTEEGQASNQTGRAVLHSSMQFCDIHRSIPLGATPRTGFRGAPLGAAASRSNRRMARLTALA